MKELEINEEFKIDGEVKVWKVKGVPYINKEGIWEVLMKESSKNVGGLK